VRGPSCGRLWRRPTRCAREAGYDGGFDAEDGTITDEKLDAVPKVVEPVQRRSRRHHARPVRRGRDHRLANAARILLRYRVAWYPHRDGVQPAWANTPTEQCAGSRVSGPGQPGRAPGVIEHREARRRRREIGDQRIK
jgi:hypothetical protein